MEELENEELNRELFSLAVDDMFESLHVPAPCDDIFKPFILMKNVLIVTTARSPSLREIN